MKTFLKTFLATSLLCLMAVALHAAPQPRESMGRVKGVQAAEKIIDIVRQDLPNSSEGQISVQRCYVFPAFVAIEIDTGEVGVDQVVIRQRAAGEPLQALCADRTRPKELKLKSEEQYIFGAAGNYLFTISADGAGEERGMWIYDALSGHQLFEAAYHEHQDFLASLSGKSLSLDYHARLRLNCDISSKEKSKCWDETRRENHVPAGVKLERPDCSAVFQSKSFRAHPELLHEPRAIQIFTKVHVGDLQHAKIDYTGGSVLCNESP